MTLPKHACAMGLYVAVSCVCLTVSVAHAESVQLVKNGNPTATVVLPADAGAVLRKAADEVVSYVAKLSGVKLPILADGTNVQGAALVLGDSKAPLPPVVRLREQHALETFSVRVSDGNVYFGGRSPEAIAYAVLAFIEDDLGVRWFAPGDLWEYLPPHTKEELTVEVSSRVVTPDTPFRRIGGMAASPSLKTWLWRNRARSLTKPIRDRFTSNMLYEAFPAARFAKTNPEYYPLIRGERFIPVAPASGRLAYHDIFWPCVSNRGVVREAAKYIGAWFDEHPDDYSFSLGMNDVIRHCHCADCIAMDRDPHAIERDDLADRTCAFINAVARQLKKTHPDRYLGFLMYRHLYKAPAKVAKLEDNVFGYITCEAASWWGKDGARLEAADKEMTKAWTRICALPVSRYEYIGLATFTPVFYPHAMDRQIKFDQEMGMEGHHIEFSSFLSNTAPMVWAFWRLQWDASLDMDALLREFYGRMFGSAAGAMANYYAFLEQVWDAPHEGRKGGFLTLSRNVDEQCTSISPGEVAKGLDLLDRALAAARQDKVRKRIGIVKASLQFAGHGVDTYWRARDMRSTTIKTAAQAEAALAAMAEYCGAAERRTGSWAGAARRQDLLGDSIRRFRTLRTLMADSLAFARTDKRALVPLSLSVLDWYGQNAPDKLPKVRDTLRAMALPESLAQAVKVYGGITDNVNLLRNPRFEETGPNTRQKGAKADWDHAGAPKAWSVYIRPPWKLGLPLSKTSVREGAGRNGSTAAVFSAGTGGVFISSIPVKPGAVYLGSVWMRASEPEAAAKTGFALKFRDGAGKLMQRDANKRVQYEETHGIATSEWQRLAASVVVPRTARSLCVMFGPVRTGKGEVLFDDARLTLVKGGPEALPDAGPNDFESLLAEGEFQQRARGHLSGANVQKAPGDDGGNVLVFTAGSRDANSYVKIAGGSDTYDLTRAVTVEARVWIDPEHGKDTMEIAGNPFMDHGKGFRLYLDKAGVHFISGSGMPRETAKRWGAHSSPKHPIKPGQWHHVAGTYDGSVFRVYVDGKLSGASDPGLALTEGQPDIGIGSFRYGLVLGFTGRIDGVDIHGRALSEAEIAQRATNGH
jgi:hypothetical protein